MGREGWGSEADRQADNTLVLPENSAHLPANSVRRSTHIQTPQTPLLYGCSCRVYGWQGHSVHRVQRSISVPAETMYSENTLKRSSHHITCFCLSWPIPLYTRYTCVYTSILKLQYSQYRKERQGFARQGRPTIQGSEGTH